MSIHVTEISEEQDDYLVSFETDEGDTVDVLIPKKGSRVYAGKEVVWNSDVPFGLNLVYGGHYQ